MKVASINRVSAAPEQRSRFALLQLPDVLTKVLAVTVFVGLLFSLWSVFDPHRTTAEYTLSSLVNEDGATVVVVRYYCSSYSDVLDYTNVSWCALLLLMATMPALKSRKFMQNSDEMHSDAIIIYSHFVFLLLRLLSYCLTSLLSQSALTRCQSLIYSGDSIATQTIYFLPKVFGHGY